MASYAFRPLGPLGLGRCRTAFAVVVLQVWFAIGVLQLWLCNCGLATVDLQLWCLQLWFRKCGFAIVCVGTVVLANVV